MGELLVDCGVNPLNNGAVYRSQGEDAGKYAHCHRGYYGQAPRPVPPDVLPGY